jgi:hypothetical protein
MQRRAGWSVRGHSGAADVYKAGAECAMVQYDFIKIVAMHICVLDDTSCILRKHVSPIQSVWAQASFDFAALFQRRGAPNAAAFLAVLATCVTTCMQMHTYGNRALCRASWLSSIHQRSCGCQLGQPWKCSMPCLWPVEVPFSTVAQGLTLRSNIVHQQIAFKIAQFSLGGRCQCEHLALSVVELTASLLLQCHFLIQQEQCQRQPVTQT